MSADQWLRLPLSAMGEQLGCLRITKRGAVASMERSLRRYGQLSTVAVCRSGEDGYELIDGFKRLHAARGIAELSELQARVLPLDGRRAKVAMLELNRSAGGVNETSWTPVSACDPTGGDRRPCGRTDAVVNPCFY